ncbi:MAG: hypothetical protein ABWY66_13850 [Xanthobacteraceae bacterium]
MRTTGLIALFAAAAITATALAVPAEAAPRNRYVSANQGTVFVSRDEDGRVRRRIIVTPRSYLDGGTEVLPGQRKFNFSDAQPYWSPIDALGPGRNYDRQPLNPGWEQGWTRMEY